MLSPKTPLSEGATLFMAGLLALAGGNAQAVSLGSLTSGGSITNGNLTFSNWTLVSEFDSTGVVVDALNNIDVSAFGPAGLQFTATLDQATLTDNLPEILGVSLSYSVAAGGGLLVNGLVQELTGYTLTPPVDNLVLVDATVAGSSSVSTFADGMLGVNQLTDSTNFAGISNALVAVNLNLNSGTFIGDTAGLGNFVQQFSVVPLPAPFLLFGSALAAIGALGRRRAGTSSSA